ncbi:hypothetical protein EBT31_20150, partial [bacterium]|nr:hypothetical protein [bacterium]
IYDAAFEPGAKAINRWIDTKLNKYIKNEMGTPEDPVRIQTDRLVAEKADALAAKDEQIATATADIQLAETPEARRRAQSKVRRLQQERESIEAQSVLHIRPYEVSSAMQDILKGKRLGADMPHMPMGVSPAARYWEAATDTAIDSYPASAYKYGALDETILERNPWMVQVPDEAMVSSVKGARHDLGFEHIIDELKNAMDPTTTLPNNLRIQPKDLDKITVPQAVERVARINDWRTQEAIRAEREGMLANLQATPRLEVPEFSLSFTEQPGGKWVDIPETVDEKGLTMCTSIGKAGGWCTQGDKLARSYGSGKNRLAALVDVEGRPHAQAMIKDTGRSAFDEWYDNIPDNLHTAYVDEFLYFDPPGTGVQNPQPRTLEMVLNQSPEWVQYLVDKMGAPSPSLPVFDILELKPPGNTFNSDRAQEYIKRDP